MICGLHLNPTWFEILWSGPRFLVATHGPRMFETVFAWMDDHRAYIPSRKLQAFQNVKNIVNTYDGQYVPTYNALVINYLKR